MNSAHRSVCCIRRRLLCILLAAVLVSPAALAQQHAPPEIKTLAPADLPALVYRENHGPTKAACFGSGEMRIKNIAPFTECHQIDGAVFALWNHGEAINSGRDFQATNLLSGKSTALGDHLYDDPFHPLSTRRCKLEHDKRLAHILFRNRKTGMLEVLHLDYATMHIDREQVPVKLLADGRPHDVLWALALSPKGGHIAAMIQMNEKDYEPGEGAFLVRVLYLPDRHAHTVIRGLGVLQSPISSLKPQPPAFAWHDNTYLACVDMRSEPGQALTDPKAPVTHVFMAVDVVSRESYELVEKDLPLGLESGGLHRLEPDGHLLFSRRASERFVFDPGSRTVEPYAGPPLWPEAVVSPSGRHMARRLPEEEAIALAVNGLDEEFRLSGAVPRGWIENEGN